MNLHQLIESAAGETATVVRGIKPDQLDAPTPCREWDVRTLANHLLQVVQALRLSGEGTPVPDELWQRDLMPGNWPDDADATIRSAVAPWADPASWEGVRHVGGAELPAAMVATMYVSDLVIHGWDLARATGQQLTCDEAVAAATLLFITESGAQGREMGIYAAPVATADGAATLDRAIALSGRDPRWTP